MSRRGRRAEGRRLPISGALRAAHPFGLRLEDGPPPSVTMLRDGDGGAIFADVIRHTEASEAFVRKQLGQTHVEDFVVEVSKLTSTGLVDWLAASWGEKPPKRDGALLACKSDFTIVLEQAFGGALISETLIPSLDVATKTPAILVVRFAAEASAPVPSSGGKLAIPLTKGLRSSGSTPISASRSPVSTARR